MGVSVDARRKGEARDIHRHHPRHSEEDPAMASDIRSPLLTKDNSAALFPVLCTLVASLGSLLLGMSLGYTSPTQPAIMSDLNLTLSEYSLFGSIVNIGAMIGAITSGQIADYIGRKKALFVAVAPTIVGWVVVAMAKSKDSLYFGRLLLGLGGGIVSFTVPIYIAETAPKRLRGTLATMHQLAITIGILLSYLGGLLLSWRMLALVAVVPGIVMLIMLLFIVETPRWLLSAGGMACSSFLVGLSFYIKTLKADGVMSTVINILVLCSLLVYIAAFSFGMGAIPWIILGEIFPSRVKAVAGSFASLVNWLCSLVVTLSFNLLLDWSPAGCFWLFTLVCVVAVVFVMKFLPETRGCSLEQIEALFNK